MPKFIIEPHFRLHEWVAEEKGYFKAEGLDYEFRELVRTTAGQIHATPDRVGAFQSLEAGRKSNVSCACHWTVAVAASKDHGRLYPGCYSVSPAGVFVPADSPVKHPQDLADVPISVGYQSGSHYSTIQALEQYLSPNKIKLNFSDGLLFARMDKLIEGQSVACSLFSGPYYFAEQLGFRKVIDTTFMIATFINGDPSPESVAKYMRALQRAQRDIDLRPDLYNRYYLNEFPEKYHARMDVRRWGPGERIVFEPYTKETFDETFKWIDERGIFENGLGTRSYEGAVAAVAG
jgi:ABC-type nitrate/sulfonate/bicarbonate transport system substrate-binding protein